MAKKAATKKVTKKKANAPEFTFDDVEELANDINDQALFDDIIEWEEDASVEDIVEAVKEVVMDGEECQIFKTDGLTAESFKTLELIGCAAVSEKTEEEEEPEEEEPEVDEEEEEKPKKKTKKEKAAPKEKKEKAAPKEKKEKKVNALPKNILFVLELVDGPKTMDDIKNAEWNPTHTTFYELFNALEAAGHAVKDGKKIKLA